MPDLGINPDWQRQARVGIGEAVFCAGKTAAQIAALVGLAEERHASLLLTRLDRARFAELDGAVRNRLDYDALSQTAVLDNGLPAAVVGGVGIVCAGTSDMAVAIEARRTLAFHGVASPLIADVGVAGLWRLLDRIAEIAAWRVAIVVAGMEGALFGVVAGLVPGSSSRCRRRSATASPRAVRWRSTPRSRPARRAWSRSTSTTASAPPAQQLKSSAGRDRRRHPPPWWGRAVSLSELASLEKRGEGDTLARRTIAVVLVTGSGYPLTRFL